MNANKYILTAFALASAVHCANASTNNLVVNGGFEDGDNGWSVSTSGNGFTSVSSVYIYERNEGTLYASTFGFPAGSGLSDDSRNAAWLGCGYSTGCTPGVNEAAWSQTLNTVAGQSYSLSFLLGAAYGSTSAGTGTVDVLWNGVKVGGQSFAGTEDTPYGSSYQVGNLIAQGHDVLQFRTVSGTVVGLDGVTVAAVPEPTTYAMLAAGLTLFGLRRRMGKTRD
ncbi:PEP-CTERM sorting domain-containing protein [Roseateles cellulosilyticus]|uniref:PEP-CTERM sorting domain-containing protein n=1 Tax=Pelomonas cellulosilytica TaxID=2906762 RepID=A0ABS8Y1Z0_9BURK|nr:PEP-CTERM sorting domain-containing protein [Pelomonas sp. P8]MCE4556993.1 PEP-CTERM sorting domain-containing protein [Pelomonas sp. P8]